MWKYCGKEQIEEFLLSLGLINKKWTNEKIIRCLYALSNYPEKHYRCFKIKKANGTARNILEPDYLLKQVQTNLLQNVLSSIPVSSYATAYYKGADVISNAAPHLCQKKILKLDIRNFFENIDFMKVYKSVFKSIYYPPAVRTLFTNLCCYDNYLPQGAPTSAVISNIVMKPFDEHIGKWCEERQIIYTRYCDDMTFSGDFDIDTVKNKVKNFLEKLDFRLNYKKTKVLSKNKRQIITGIVVNEKIQTSKMYRKNIRQEIYYIKKLGISFHLKYHNIDVKEIKYLYSLLGKINFILHINADDKEFIEAKKFIVNAAAQYNNN